MNERTTVAAGVTEVRLARLRRWNVGLAVLHGAQAVLILVLAGHFAVTITSTFPTGPPGTALPAPESILDVRVGPASPCSWLWRPSII